MKKIELKFGAQKMSKEQMKMVIGGEVSGCGVTEGGSFIGFIPCYGGDICACQDYYDADCMNSNTCDDVDCGCK